MTYKISCLQSEKSENAVQIAHRCPHIYLSGQFLKVHLKKYTLVNFTPTQTQYKQSEKQWSWQEKHELALPSLASTFAKYVRRVWANSSANVLFFDTDTPPFKQSNCCSIQAWKKGGEKISINQDNAMSFRPQKSTGFQENTGRTHWFKTNLK